MSVLSLEPQPSRHRPWGALASVAAHLGLLGLLLLVSPVRPLAPARTPQSIAVELVAPPARVPAPAPSARTTPLAAPTGSVAAVAPPSAAGRAASAPDSSTPHDGLTRATKLFSTAMLKEPASRKIARTLSKFADSEKLVQLCNMEGLEQIRRANSRYDPDVLVSYAMADTAVDGMTLIADGGAFHSGKAWFAIRFRCTAAADYSGITAFAFSLGAPIPRALWASHNLPEQYEDSE